MTQGPQTLFGVSDKTCQDRWILKKTKAWLWRGWRGREESEMEIEWIINVIQDSGSISREINAEAGERVSDGGDFASGVETE